jgi:hypothetical protein
VERALEEISDNCANLERNAACYGFNRVDATFVDEIADDYFSLPADRAGLKTLNTIQNAPMDVDLEHWGITVMSVQANVPNSLPGQAVVFMLLGDVEVENAVSPDQVFEGLETPISVTTLTASNLRSFPSLNANVVSSVGVGTILDADGISADQGWLRVVVSTGPAWISRQLVQDVAALSDLPTITSENRSPMQAFYFSTGFGQPNCEESPPSTLVVQGPNSVIVDITANGADISIGSTIALRTLENGVLQLVVLSGEATVGGITIPAGFTISIQLSEDGTEVIGAWFDWRPLTAEELAEFQPLENIPANLLNYPIILPTLQQIMALYNAILAANQGVGQPGAPGNNGNGNGGGAGSSGDSLVSGVDCSGFNAASPGGWMPRSPLPFYWTEATGATHYVVNIYNDQGDLIHSFLSTGDATSLTIDPLGLSGGPAYSWSVSAYLNGQFACSTIPISTEVEPDPNETEEPDPEKKKDEGRKKKPQYEEEYEY